MTLCEFHFEHVLILGGEEYLDAMAARLDELFAAEWVLDDAIRSPSHDGWWEICLYRPADRRPSPENSLR
jgi:hypothetical protein